MAEASSDLIGVIRPLITFDWVAEFSEIVLGQKYNSPLFRSTDSKKEQHDWKLEFQQNEPVDEYSRRENFLTLKYLDEEEIALSNIQFQVVLRVQSGYIEVLHNDMDPKFDMPQYGSGPLKLSKEISGYTVQFESDDLDPTFTLRIFCIIIPAFEACNDVSLGFTNQQHANYLRDEYELLLLNSKFSDSTVSVAKKELHLHKDILSSRSLYFSKMFANEMSEMSTNTVIIEDFTYEVMLELFRYIYAAKVNDIKTHMVELLIAADKYAVEGLKSLCEQEIIKALNLENAILFLSIANCHNAKDLEAQCIKYIVLNAKNIVDSPNFDLGNLPKELTNKLFRSLAKCEPVSVRASPSLLLC